MPDYLIGKFDASQVLQISAVFTAASAAAAKTAAGSDTDFTAIAGTDIRCLQRLGSIASATGGATETTLSSANSNLNAINTATSGLNGKIPASAGLSDNTANPNSTTIQAANALWNGSAWDRQRGNLEATLLSSTGRTSTAQSSDIVNFNGKGLILFVNVTSAGSGSITPTLQVKDPVSGSYKTIWQATTAIESNGLYAYMIYPGAASVGIWTEIAQCVVPRTSRLEMVANNSNSITYSVGASFLL
ncbi:MAG: hypothetical protein WAQ98_11050 [Blastocatellia bacterium]